MNELKFNVVQSIGEITANFDEFKNQVSQELEKYKSKEFTEDTKKDAKKDLAELRKKKAAVNERRIEVKKEYMKPYDEFEAKILVMVDGAIAQPVMSDPYNAEKIPLSNAYGIELFYHFGTKSVTPDLIFKNKKIGG